MKRTILRILLIILLSIACLFSGVVVGIVVGSNLGITIGTDNPTDLSTLQQVQYYLTNDFYFGERTEEYVTKLTEDAIYGMVDAQKDPHTTYMSASELAEFTGSLESSFVGVGITYTPLEGNILVITVIRSSPAEKAGILPGDIVIEVDGVACGDIEDIASAVKGERLTKVELTVNRNGEIIKIPVIRDSVSNTVFSYVKNGVGVLQITSFADGTGEEVGNHLDYLKENNCKNLIIDLRDNTGGYVFTLDKISSYFMDNGDVIMREYDRDGKEYVDAVKNSNRYNFDKIVILLNSYSASCSEVFTMAMVENVGAITVGQTSYGKGVAQSTVRLKDGGALKYTDLIWKSSKGVYIGGEGIHPDYEILLHDALYLNYLKFEENETYQYDVVSDIVARVQTMLNFLDYQTARNDGYFDISTVEAIKQFQKDKGLTVNGVIDYDTANQLNSSVVQGWSTNKDKYDVQMNKALELCK